MAFLHGKDTKLYANGYDVTGYFRSVPSEVTRELGDSTVFGLNDKTFLAGQREASASPEGLFDGAAAAIDAILDTIFGAEARSLWSVWFGGDAVGNRGFGIDAHQTKYKVDAPHNEVVSTAVELRSSVGREALVSHHALAAETANGQSAAVDGGAASSNGGVGYLHVPDVTTITNIVVVIEDSADGSSGWATILTFAAVTADNAKERVAISGTVRRYTRARWTITGGPGSATFNAGFGRK